MTPSNPPGYPLPDGDLGEDEIVCQLVYLPDRPEYWQALLAAIHYFSTWRAWERDDDKRGKDAAANWRDAFELTIGCWRMTCLEELTQTVTDILELLQTRKDCCDDNITYLPVDGIETDIIPFVGDPPEVYGETAIEDWDEWAEHVCFNAHAYVDYLAHAGDSLWEAAKSSSIVIGLIAAILSLLAFSGIGLPIAFGLAAGIVSGIVLGGQIATFAGTKEAIEAARDDIVCAILQGTGIAVAVEDALESGLDWDLFYQWIPYGSAMAIIYEGGHDSEFLPSETSDDCYCGPELEEGQLIKNPSWVGGTDYWDLVDWEWRAGQPGYYGNLFQAIPFQTEYDDFKSDNFVIPAGVTEVRGQIRALSRSGKPSCTWHFRLFDASDDSVIDTYAINWGEGDDNWYTKDYAVYDVVPLTVCYVKIIGVDGDGYTQYIDWVKCWEV